MSAAAIVAVVSAAVSVVVTLYGFYERHRAFKAQQYELDRQQARWSEDFKAERRLQQILLQKDFHLEQYRYRVASYGDVLRTLGAVSDVAMREDPDAYRKLHDNPELLRSTADALFEHLYGKPGLLMTMETRNVLHGARQSCLSFLTSDGTKTHCDRLADAFFYARRYLRADLELLDDRSAANLRKLVDQLAAETPQSEQR